MLAIELFSDIVVQSMVGIPIALWLVNRAIDALFS